MPIDQHRHDVVASITSSTPGQTVEARCGFEFATVLHEGNYELGFEFSAGIVWVACLSISASDVIQGRHGMLFLGGDSNRSRRQHNGGFFLRKSWHGAWASYFQALDDLCRANAIRHCFVVAPSKEEVFPDYYPDTMSEHRPINALLKHFSERIIWPAPTLSRVRAQAYDNGDTHWTDFGARVAADLCLQALGIDLPEHIPHRYSCSAQPGDLSDKLDDYPNIRLLAHWPHRSTLRFDNCVINSGNIRVYSNDSPVHDGSLLIFGGSSSLGMVKYLRELFRRTVVVHTAGHIDVAIMKHEKPDYVIVQTSQRFIVTPSICGIDIFSGIAEKQQLNLLHAPGESDAEVASPIDEPFYESLGQRHLTETCAQDHQEKTRIQP